ncbi:MAG: TSUP family transporter, partial [Pseudolabrys sp.]
LAIYAGLGLIKVEFSVPPRAELWLGFVAGIATGAVTVATGVFALPGVPYIQALHFERDRLVQALGLSFTVSTVTLTIALAYAGEMHMALAWPSLLALGAAAFGMWIGQFVRGKVKPATFRLFFFLGLLVLGAHLMLRELL